MFFLDRARVPRRAVLSHMSAGLDYAALRALSGGDRAGVRRYGFGSVMSLERPGMIDKDLLAALAADHRKNRSDPRGGARFSQGSDGGLR